MTEEQRLLIALVSVALQSDSITLPYDKIDWNIIINLSYQQEVTALALDGYQLVHNKLGRQAIDKVSLLNWAGGVIQQEAQSERQFQLAKELSEYLSNHGICTFVLKGFSIAQCYPIPRHRYSCDFDCFLIGKDADGRTISMQEKGDELIESKGIEIDRSYYKNSSIVYKDLHIENHRFCCSIKRGKRTKALEKYLEELLFESRPAFISDTRIALPPLMFQAIFMIEHACSHFLYEKMSLKNICDWAVFRNKYKKELDWDEFDTACERFGLKAFAETMGRLSNYVLGLYEYSNLTLLEKKVLNDTLRQFSLPQNKMFQRVIKGWRIVCSGWKFKHFSNDSMMKELGSSIYAYMFEKESQACKIITGS